jgi:hypothetical protein
MPMARPLDRCSAGEALLKRIVSTSHSVMVTMLEGYSTDQNSMQSIGPESRAFPSTVRRQARRGLPEPPARESIYRSSRESLLWE